jgi:heat shock protein HtpX
VTIFRNQLKTILLLGAMSALLVGIGGLVAPSYLYLFGALALITNLGAYFFSDRIVLRMHGASEVLVALVAPLIATLVQLGISRSREYLADATGAQISGDPASLASALVKLERAAESIPPLAPTPAMASLFIVNPFGPAESASRLFSTHPSTEERVRRLRGMARQSFPRRGNGGIPVLSLDG